MGKTKVKHSLARRKGRFRYDAALRAYGWGSTSTVPLVRNNHSRQYEARRMFLPNQQKMRVFQLPQRHELKRTAESSSPSTSFYSMWDAIARFAQEIRASDFMAEMIRRRDGYGAEGVMGALDCATLYGLTRWLRPAVVVESGRVIGMSSPFILSA